LLDATGRHLKDTDTPISVLEEAYALRVLARKAEASPAANKKPDDPNTKTLEEVITAYLDHSKATDRPSTYERRADFLFDFCYGFSGKFRSRDGKAARKPSPGDRIHDGYGTLTVAELLPFHAQQWADLHAGWADTGGRRFALQALKRALNWVNEVGIISIKPLYRLKVSRGRSRISYFTPEVEQAMYANSRSAFRLALTVCIRTGARYGSEFAKLQARHVHETEFGQVWRFPPEETKNKKQREILVAPDIAVIVRRQIKEHGQGFVFRNSRGTPWTGRELRCCFIRLKNRLKKKAILMGKDDVMYTTRHTYAKRMLAGYWGEKVTLLDLADLMGDSRDTIIAHYTQWESDHQAKRLWAGINGTSHVEKA
jgi:integrase